MTLLFISINYYNRLVITQRGRYSRCAHTRCLVPKLQLLSQTLVESKRAGLGTAVVHHLTQRQETGHTGNGHHMAVVLAHHGGQELAHRQEMRQRVDLHRLTDLGLWLLQHGSFMGNTRVVDQYRGFSVVCADLVANGLDIGGIGDVAAVEGHLVGYYKSVPLKCNQPNAKGQTYAA